MLKNSIAEESWDPSPEQLELRDEEIHVWRACLDCDEQLLRQFEATLASDEIVRANRFLFQKDRDNFIAARGILRELLGRYMNQSPAQLKFKYGSKGKPSLNVEPNESAPHFNISHSHGMALFGFAVHRQLGVDLELVRTDFGGEEIAECYFSPLEVEELRSLPPSLRSEGFFLCWTRKEAYIKARGEGLSIPLKSFRVSLTPGQPNQLQSSDSFHWSLHSFRPASHYVGALVGEGKNWQLRCWDWKPTA